MSWSRKNRTLYCSSRSRSSAKTSASCAASARLMLRSSAPMVAVRGTTSIARVPVRTDGSCCRPRASLTTVCMVILFSVREDRTAGSGARRLQAEDGGPDAAAGLEVAVGRDGVVEGVALADVDGDSAGADVVEELPGEFSALRGVRDVV